MEALLNALGDKQNLGSVVKHLKELDSNAVAAPVHVEKVVAHRSERKEVYAKTREDMDKWKDTVTANRAAKTLDIAGDKRQPASYKSLISKYTAMNDFEKEIQMVLVQTGATDHAAEVREIDELQARSLSLDEIKQRQADIAKVKARMFYDQMKRHRINKIKSKAYHRIRKHQKKRRGANNEDDSDEEGNDKVSNNDDEKVHLERIKERMSLRHKNTGKWAKMAQDVGKRDQSVRAAYNESLQLGQKLLEKVHENNEKDDLDDDEDEDDDNNDSDQDESDEDNEDDLDPEYARKVANQLKRAIDDDESEEEGFKVDGKYKKLFEMDFMKKAHSKQNMRMKDEAKALLREVEETKLQMDADSDDDMDDNRDSTLNLENIGDLGQGPSFRAKKKMDTVNNAKTAVVKVNANTHVKETSSTEVPETENTKKSQVDQWQVETSKKGKKDKKNENNESARVATSNNNNNSNNNKSVSKTNSNNNQTNSNIATKGVSFSTAAVGSVSTSGTVTVSVSGGSSNIPPKTQPQTVVNAIVNTKEATKAKPTNERKPLLMQKSQSQLVQMAFAGPDLEQEFADLKSANARDEAGTAQERAKIEQDVKAGWGDWAGPGKMVSTKLERMRDKKRAVLDVKEAEAIAKRSDAKMPHVVISQRRASTQGRYEVAEAPHPFDNSQHYQSCMQRPLGEEWNATQVFRNNTKPDILLRAGRLIDPLAAPKGQKRKSDESAPVKKQRKIK